MTVIVNNENVSFLTRVASLYHIEGLTQQEAANRVGVSRQTIGRLLQQARDVGIVHIEIRSPHAEVESLARKLEKVFGLVEALVVTTDRPGDEATKEALGRSAAGLVARRIRPGMVLGLGWSTTVVQFVCNLEPLGAAEIRITQLDGGIPHTRQPTQAAHIIEKSAEALDAQGVTLMAPLYVDSTELRNSLVLDSTIAATLELSRHADIATFGIGTVSRRSNLYETGYLTDGLIDELLAEGAVGEILGRFYDANGNLRGAQIASRTIGTDLSELRGIPLSCALAAGSVKVPAILGALRGGYCNTLVTDDRTAIALLQAVEDQSETTAPTA
jgi:DNA-binding transcriptional regulator LsrR (DeoR family)